MAAAQDGLESQNRRAEVGESKLAHLQAREQVKSAEVVVATRREPHPRGDSTRSVTWLGLSGPEEFQSDGELVDSLGEEELREFRQGAVRPGKSSNGEGEKGEERSGD